jgi:hypothetical protein
VSGQTFTDSTDNSSGFAAGTINGGTGTCPTGTTCTGTIWDSTNDFVRLINANDAVSGFTPTNTSQLDASWAPAWSNIQAVWHLDEASGATSIIDSSGNGHNGVPTGVTSGGTGQLNKSASFNGTSSEVVTTYTQTSVTAYTVSAWLKTTSGGSSSGNNSAIFYNRGASGSGYSGKSLTLYEGVGGASCGTSGGISFVLDSNGIAIGASTSSTINDGNWHYVVGTWAASSGTAVAPSQFTIYIDGKAASTSTCSYGSATSPLTGLNGAIIGESPANSGYYTGSIDELAVWNTALTSAQVANIYLRQRPQYTGNFTSRILNANDAHTSWTSLGWTTTLPFFKPLPDYASSAVQEETNSSYSSLTDNSLMNGIVGLWHLDEPVGTSGSGTILDRSGNSYNGTPTSVTLGVAGRLSSAASFNGSSSYIALPAAAGQTTDYTYSAWFNTVSGGVILSSSQTSPASNPSGYDPLLYVGTDGYLHGGNYNGGSIPVTIFSSSSKVTDGKWHLAVTSGNGSLQYLYLDGVLQASATYGAADLAYFQIGTGYTQSWADGNSSWYYFNGSIDEVAAWSRALTSTEILQLYRRGANRIKYQVRPCADSACAANPSWQGPDGTNQSYFSELYNNSAQSSYQGLWTGSPVAFPLGGDPSSSFTVLPTLPDLVFSDFTSMTSLTTSSDPYIQYRAVLESDDTSTACNYDSTSTWCSPELQSVTIQTQ